MKGHVIFSLFSPSPSPNLALTLLTARTHARTHARISPAVSPHAPAAPQQQHQSNNPFQNSPTRLFLNHKSTERTKSGKSKSLAKSLSDMKTNQSEAPKDSQNEEMEKEKEESGAGPRKSSRKHPQTPTTESAPRKRGKTTQ